MQLKGSTFIVAGGASGLGQVLNGETIRLDGAIRLAPK